MSINSVTNPESFITLEGRDIVLSYVKTGPTTATVSWTLPKTTNAYDGALVLVSQRELNPSNQPTDGVTYVGSSDLSAPANTIGSAVVAAALYGDRTTSSVDLTGLVDGVDYFCGLHLITSGKQYYQFGVMSTPRSLDTEPYSGDIVHLDAPPTNPTVGQVYFDLNTRFVLMWNGTTWMPASTETVATGDANPAAVAPAGTFFFNTRLKRLYTSDGARWNEVAMQNHGQPMTDKKFVGTDGSYAERLSLISTVKKILGWPVICVELTEDHFNVAIDQALQEFRRRSDSAYTRRFVLLTVKPDQHVYYLNDPALGTNKITDVVKAHRLSGLGLMQLGDGGSYYQQIVRDMIMPGAGGGQIDMVSVHLLAQLGETFTQLFAGDIDCQYYEPTRELRMNKRFQRDERVVLECVMEKTEQELLVDRYTSQWIQSWTLSECWEILGMIRSKFGSLPGAGGGVSLNGDSLLAKAQEEQTELLRQIQDFEVGNGAGFGNYSFTIG